MTINENPYERKADFNPNRKTYVNEDGSYVYLIWDEDLQDYRKEVYPVGENGFTPEIRAALDEMDAEEERRLDADDRHIAWLIEKGRKACAEDASGHTPDPMDNLEQRRQRTFEDAVRDDPRVGQLIDAMAKLTPGQVDLIYAKYGEMKFEAEIAREEGVSRQAINNRLKKVHARLAKLMAEMDEE